MHLHHRVVSQAVDFFVILDRIEFNWALSKIQSFGLRKELYISRISSGSGINNGDRTIFECKFLELQEVSGAVACCRLSVDLDYTNFIL